MSALSLWRRSAFTPSLLDELFPWFNDENLPARTMTVPAVNITEENGQYKLSMAAPGLQKEDFSIDVDDAVLTISASKEEEKKDEKKENGYSRKEYSYHSFSRSFTLPDSIQKDKIEASYKDGVLELKMPKVAAKASNGTKKISID